jgi:ABC-2 type transport system permease protein
MSVTWHGIRTVAGHEFRVRLRTGRWRWLFGAWLAVLLGFTALLRWALVASRRGDAPEIGTPMFGGLMLFILALSLLVVPSLTAQSVNGDRERGVLATLQVTLLSATEIALGKLLAAWGTALAFVAVSLPAIAWSVAEGGVGLGRVAVTLLVVAVLLGVVCALAQCLSALLARSTTSAVMSYLVVFALTIGTVIAFGLGAAATTTRETVTEQVPVWDTGPPEEIGPNGEYVPNPPDRYQTETYETTVTHPDKVWWLLAPNPFVILADAAPRVPPRRDRFGNIVGTPLDPLGGIGNEVRAARTPRDDRRMDMVVPGGPPVSPVPPPEPAEAPPVWPYGLTALALLGVTATGLTVLRLRTPYRVLPRAVRVA